MSPYLETDRLSGDGRHSRLFSSAGVTDVSQPHSLLATLTMKRVQVARDGSVEAIDLPSERDHVRRSNAIAHAWEPSPEASIDSDQILHRLGSYSTWIAALKMQALVVRNAAESIACAWIPNAFYALGNVFSGEWYTAQSRSDLLVANSVYASIAFCTVVFISFIPMMMSLRYADSLDRRPSVWFCVQKLSRTTIVYFVAAVGIMFAFSCLIAYLSSIEPGIFQYKLECYVDNLTLLIYFTGITRAVKQIYYEETPQGRDRLHQIQQKSRSSKIMPSTIATAESTVRRGSFKPPGRHRKPPFWRSYINNLPGSSPPFLACVFVHFLSRQRIVDSGSTVLTGFVVAGIVFKLATQELAKHYIFKKRVRSTRVMCVLIGIPTVLIDTQTRIILLGTNSTKTAVVGALGMALIEISLRTGKAAMVMWEIHHHKAVHARQSASTPQRRVISNMFSHRSTTRVVAAARSAPRPSLSTGSSDFELWRQQVQAFHTAELNADMYAEYISIGCSASILFFYGNHPHYSLLRQSANAETVEVDMMAWRVGQLSMMAVQIGVEVIVDYVSIVLEMVIGIEFDDVKSLGSFLAALFMIAAVMNTTISIGFYLS